MLLPGLSLDLGFTVAQCFNVDPKVVRESVKSDEFGLQQGPEIKLMKNFA